MFLKKKKSRPLPRCDSAARRPSSPHSSHCPDAPRVSAASSCHPLLRCHRYPAGQASCAPGLLPLRQLQVGTLRLPEHAADRSHLASLRPTEIAVLPLSLPAGRRADGARFERGDDGERDRDLGESIRFGCRKGLQRVELGEIGRVQICNCHTQNSFAPNIHSYGFHCVC